MATRGVIKSIHIDGVDFTVKDNVKCVRKPINQWKRHGFNRRAKKAAKRAGFYSPDDILFQANKDYRTRCAELNLIAARLVFAGKQKHCGKFIKMKFRPIIHPWSFCE